MSMALALTGHGRRRGQNKLLMFDRTAAARTQVYDDQVSSCLCVHGACGTHPHHMRACTQADYFADTSSSWLSKAERDRAARAETTRRQDMHTRKTVRGTDNSGLGCRSTAASSLRALTLVWRPAASRRRVP